MDASEITEDKVKQALRDVIDPELGDNLVDLGMVGDVTIDGTHVTVGVALTIASCPLRNQLDRDVTDRVSSLAGVESVSVEMAEMDPKQRSDLMARARWKARESALETDIPSRTRILAVASGKGGVGKSSVTTNLAVGLARQGKTVGVLDADIAGFSLPRILGLDKQLHAEDGKIIPLDRAVGTGTLRVVSMGLVSGSGEDEAVMLRGLMLNRALQHFLEDVSWGDLDYLLIDMPPGTGDIQMGLARMLPRADLLVVTTPAVAAQQVAARAIDMARRGHLRVGGIIENMSHFTCDHGERYELFGSGGGQRLSSTTGIPLLAQLPFSPELSRFADNGQTVVEEQPDSEVGIAFNNLAARVSERIAPLVEMGGCSSRMVEALEAALDKSSPAS